MLSGHKTLERGDAVRVHSLATITSAVRGAFFGTLSSLGLGSGSRTQQSTQPECMVVSGRQVPKPNGVYEGHLAYAKTS